MKTLGILRRADNLGRVVIPKEFRDMLHIKTDTMVEFFMKDGKIVLQKHNSNNINDKIDELISLIYENMEIIGLDECSVLEKELKEIAQMFEE